MYYKSSSTQSPLYMLFALRGQVLIHVYVQTISLIRRLYTDPYLS